MPNIKSAKKRVKVIAAKTLQNKAINSALKTEIKKANLALEAKAEDKAEAVRTAIKKIDQAAAKGILHKKTAARRKSALARKLNTTSAS
ncbi:MAG: 30S ribosomal protein S20 [Clostridium sp.]|uniref:30S ribosomal protein S20 n=1 Tax=Clostridium sp. TaxID=1506 RepID=UPI00290DE6C4|nr:30S ribosomal protein S20 [Clostridium sp.]MDU7339173.1 30S ribosomal protein S20 [Clostridium sp.]